MSEPIDTTVIDPVDPTTGRRPIVVALAAAGAVLLGVMIWWFLLAPLLGDDAEPLGIVPTGQPEAAAPADVSPGVDEIDDVPIAVTYEVLLDRDPFDPVVPRPASESVAVETATSTEIIPMEEDQLPVAGDPATDGNDAGDDGWVDGSEPPAAAPTPVVTEPAGCSATETGAVCDGRAVGLVRISDVDGRRVAIIQVDSTIHEVEKGEVFAANFRLRSVGEDRVTVLYGVDEFTLQVGERVLK